MLIPSSEVMEAGEFTDLIEIEKGVGERFKSTG